LNKDHLTPANGLVLSILLVASFLAVLLYLDAGQQVERTLNWLDQQGNWATVWFALFMVIAVIFLLPGLPLTMGAGFVFGIAKGTLLVVLGTTLGASAAFVLARYFLGARARQWLLGRSGLQAITENLSSHAFKIVLLTRMVPFFPFKLSNYLFGVMHFRQDWEREQKNKRIR
jgi:uncharacterized membrane protein YdjX (TVP38/TMEM64 family)